MMILTITEYRDIVDPKLPLHLLGDIHFQLKLFDQVFKDSKEGSYKHTKFDLHHESDDIKVFNIQEIVLEELESFHLIIKVKSSDRYIINPKVVKFIDERNKLNGIGINLN